MTEKIKDKMIIEPSNTDKNNSQIHKKKEHQTTPRISYRKDNLKSYRKERGKDIEDNLKIY